MHLNYTALYIWFSSSLSFANCDMISNMIISFIIIFELFCLVLFNKQLYNIIITAIHKKIPRNIMYGIMNCMVSVKE